MKKILFFVSFAISIFVLTGCNSLEENKAEKTINAYYNALIKKDFAVAFNELLLYDDAETISDGTNLSNDEAERFFLEKIEYVEKQDYELTDFEILEVEYEDGHSFWHHVEVEGEINSKSFSLKEVVFLDNGKLVVSSKDPYIDYRNGNMNVELEKH